MIFTVLYVIRGLIPVFRAQRSVHERVLIMLWVPEPSKNRERVWRPGSIPKGRSDKHVVGVLWSDQDGWVCCAEEESGIEEMLELPKAWCRDCKFHVMRRRRFGVMCDPRYV